MKSCKILMISAEISALICLALLLYMSAKDNMFDYVRAAMAYMFAITAIMTHSIQQDIKWDE